MVNSEEITCILVAPLGEGEEGGGQGGQEEEEEEIKMEEGEAEVEAGLDTPFPTFLSLLAVVVTASAVVGASERVTVLAMGALVG